MMTTILTQLGCPEELCHFEETVNRTMQAVCKDTAIPAGIAETRSLLENLFCIVVCIDACQPLIIVGPAGCSKTLSFTIAMDNMKGEQSEHDLYKQLKRAYPFRFQCGNGTTDTELRDVYRSAIVRQAEFDQSELGMCRSRCVVFLEEAGLTSEEKMPLKVLHYELDNPRVATVMLSNKVLDAAKSNRAVQLLQSALSEHELKQLVIGCLDVKPTDTPLRHAIVEGLVSGFEEILAKAAEEVDERIFKVCACVL